MRCHDLHTIVAIILCEAPTPELPSGRFEPVNATRTPEHLFCRAATCELCQQSSGEQSKHDSTDLVSVCVVADRRRSRQKHIKKIARVGTDVENTMLRRAGWGVRKEISMTTAIVARDSKSDIC
jgi:hypothetical protein